MNLTRNLILLNVGVGVVCIGLGVIIGYFSKYTEEVPSWVDTARLQMQDIDENTVPTYINQVSSENIRENLKVLADKPHMASTAQDDVLVNYINDKWNEYLDESEIVSYEILLSFPSSEVGKENIATAFNADGSTNFTTRTSEIVYPEFMKSPDTIVPYFNAFAPSGTVQGKLVYANFGSREDFAYLANQGIDLNGTIALTKYGTVGRGERTIYAKLHGVVGVLVYSDPENYALEGDEGYPNDGSLPGTGVQRGSASGQSGDPSTPQYPSIKSAYRIPTDEIPYFPVLPLQPIASDDAEKLISLLDNTIPTDKGWSTGLNGKKLNIGPGFLDGGELKLSVNNELKYIITKNVIGKIRGSTEPDSWVMYGNHRDSWVYGAVDPSSGTACMLEMTRVMGEMLKNGWRPKRTMMFGSWGAEEFGLIGSVEWAQENAQLLSERAVSYINVDIAVYGNITFNAGASHTMKQLLMDATRKVQDPWDNSKTVLDTWTQHQPGTNPEELNVKRLYSGSDYAYFYHALGVTASDLSYRFDPKDPRAAISPYPTYHTAYDTFDYVDRFLDPGFIAHTTICKVAGSALLTLADSLIIPFDPRDMAAFVQQQIDAAARDYTTQFGQDSINYLKEAGQSMTNNANAIMTYINEKLDRNNLGKIAAINNRLRLFEKSFIEPAALPGTINYKHISGTPPVNGGTSFTSIDAILYGVPTLPAEYLKLAKQQLAMITYRILNAAKSLLLDEIVNI